MSPEVTLRAIAGFRLVTAMPDRLTSFYQTIGFAIEEVAPIGAAEMAVLDLEGSGWRRSMVLGKGRLDIDWFEHAGRSYPQGTSASDLVFQHLALVTDDADRAWRFARDAGAGPIWLYGVIAIGAWVFIYFLVPETKGKSLEQIEAYWQTGKYGV